MTIEEPRMVRLGDSRNDTLARSLRENVTRDQKLAVAVFTVKQDDRYRYAAAAKRDDKRRDMTAE